MPTGIFERADLGLLLALAEHGNLARAARAVGVHHATAFRRLADLEHRARARLFERLPHGYRLTRAGERVAAPAAELQRALRALDATVLEEDRVVAGPVRVTTSDGLATAYLAPHLRALADAHPGLTLELLVENRLSDLAEREVDVAIRPAQRLAGNMVGRKAAAMAYALYASKDYLRRHGRLDARAPDFAGHAVCHYDDSIAYFSTAKWLARYAGKARVAARCNHLTAMREMARAGLGIAALPCVLGDAEGGLVRALGPVPAMETGLWLCTHPGIRKVARIRAVLDFLHVAISRDAARLAG
jgi:DNA-binding transcriptional LysR family regulator